MHRKSDVIAFDRSSVRSTDIDGRLRVETSAISKSNTCGYFGSEIPSYKELGLDASKIYMLYRDPAELALAADTFNNLPLLSKHVPVSADKPMKGLVVGSTGTDAAFDGTYLTNSLVVWDSVSIAGITSKVQCELSSAYRYKADMTPGIADGVAYDGRMTNIVGNHVALVEVGRAGPDVVVGDSNPFISKLEYQNMKASRKAVAIRAALSVFLRSQIAMDSSAVDIGALVRGVKSATIAQDMARIVKAVVAAAPDVDAKELAEVMKLAADAEPDDEKDDKKKPAAFDSDEQGDDETDAEYKKRMEAKKAAMDAEEDDKKDDDKKDSKAAMDAAIKSAVARTEQSTIARMNAIRQAEKDVQPLIGEVVAQDSAEAVYKLALDHAGVDTEGVHVSAYRALVSQILKSAEVKVAPRVAMDAAHTTDFDAMYPTRAKLVRG